MDWLWVGVGQSLGQEAKRGHMSQKGSNRPNEPSVSTTTTSQRKVWGVIS